MGVSLSSVVKRKTINMKIFFKIFFLLTVLSTITARVFLLDENQSLCILSRYRRSADGRAQPVKTPKITGCRNQPSQDQISQLQDPKRKEIPRPALYQDYIRLPLH